MKPKSQPRDEFELFQAHFDQLLNPGHELILLANQIDWPGLDAAFTDCYSPDMGAPAKAVRVLIALGLLLYLGVGYAGLFLGGNFLDYDVLAQAPVQGQLLGIFLVELGVGTTVAAAMVTIFFTFAERGRGRDRGRS